MTHINFYVGKGNSFSGRVKIACRLVNMAHDRNLHIHIHTDSLRSAMQLDAALWTLQEDAFLPHSVLDEEQQPDPLDTITISHCYEPIQHCDYLINLSNERPDFFSRFDKMAEIIDQDETILTAGRKRYAFYRNRGYTLEYHQL